MIKDKLIGLKLTSKEYELIDALAKEWKCSRQKVIRRIVFKGDVTVLSEKIKKVLFKGCKVNSNEGLEEGK